MIRCNLDYLLKKSNISQKELSEKLNINKNTVSNYINDNFITINKEHLDLFCKEFNCSPNDIFEYVTDDDPFGDIPTSSPKTSRRLPVLDPCAGTGGFLANMQTFGDEQINYLSDKVKILENNVFELQEDLDFLRNLILDTFIKD